MHKETLASEVIRETQETLTAVITELDCMDCDFEKALLMLGELLDLLDMREPETMQDALLLHEKQKQIDLFAGIAIDYISKLQTTISDIVIRERRKNKKDRAEGGAI